MVGTRKHHLLVTIALLWLVAASCLLESVDARKSRGRSKRRPKDVNIEIYHPKGVMIWYPYRAGMEMFGIEIYINKANQPIDSSEEDYTPPECDICLNTTEVSYGKFILRSENAVIRSRDHVYYNAIKKKTNGKAYVSRSNDFYVSESRILLSDMSGSERASCNESTAVANLSQEDKQLVKEIKLLEDILLELNDQCHGPNQNRTNQLLLSAETPTRYDAKQLYQFAVEQLTEKLPTIDWNRTLVDAFYTGNVIGFEVASTVDKLKVLKLAKDLPNHPVSDLDTFQTEDMSNDIEAWLEG